MLKLIIEIQHEHSLMWRDLDQLVDILLSDYGICVIKNDQGVWLAYEILDEQIFSMVLLKFNIDIEFESQKPTDRG